MPTTIKSRNPIKRAYRHTKEFVLESLGLDDEYVPPPPSAVPPKPHYSHALFNMTMLYPLPLEIMLEIISYLDCRSVLSLLVEYPDLRKHCIFISDFTDDVGLKYGPVYYFRKLEGVTRMKFKDYCPAAHRQPIRLFELSNVDVDAYDESYHSCMYTPKYLSKYINKTSFVSIHGATLKPHAVAQLLDLFQGLGAKCHFLKKFDQSVIRMCEEKLPNIWRDFHGRGKTPKLYYQAVEQNGEEYLSCPHSLQHHAHSRISHLTIDLSGFTNPYRFIRKLDAPYVEVLRIFYQGKLPPMEEISVNCGERRLTRGRCVFELTDVNAMDFDPSRPVPKALNTNAEIDKLDLAFLTTFHEIILNGTPDYLLTKLPLSVPTAHSVCQSITWRRVCESVEPVDFKALGAISVPMLDSFHYETALPDSVVPHLSHFRPLKSLAIKTTAAGLDLNGILQRSWTGPYDSIVKRHIYLSCQLPHTRLSAGDDDQMGRPSLSWDDLNMLYRHYSIHIDGFLYSSPHMFKNAHEDEGPLAKEFPIPKRLSLRLVPCQDFCTGAGLPMFHRFQLLCSQLETFHVDILPSPTKRGVVTYDVQKKIHLLLNPDEYTLRHISSNSITTVQIRQGDNLRCSTKFEHGDEPVHKYWLRQFDGENGEWNIHKASTFYADRVIRRTC